MMGTIRPDQVYCLDNEYVLADLSETWEDLNTPWDDVVRTRAVLLGALRERYSNIQDHIDHEIAKGDQELFPVWNEDELRWERRDENGEEEWEAAENAPPVILNYDDEEEAPEEQEAPEEEEVPEYEVPEYGVQEYEVLEDEEPDQDYEWVAPDDEATGEDVDEGEETDAEGRKKQYVFFW